MQPRIGATVTSIGGKPNTMVEGPSKSILTLKVIPIMTPTNILKPIEPSLSGPNTKEMPKNTSPSRDSGKKSFLQKASSNEAEIWP